MKDEYVLVSKLATMSSDDLIGCLHPEHKVRGGFRQAVHAILSMRARKYPLDDVALRFLQPYADWEMAVFKQRRAVEQLPVERRKLIEAAVEHGIESELAQQSGLLEARVCRRQIAPESIYLTPDGFDVDEELNSMLRCSTSVTWPVRKLPTDEKVARVVAVGVGLAWILTLAQCA